MGTGRVFARCADNIKRHFSGAVFAQEKFKFEGNIFFGYAFLVIFLYKFKNMRIAFIGYCLRFFDIFYLLGCLLRTESGKYIVARNKLISGHRFLHCGAVRIGRFRFKINFFNFFFFKNTYASSGMRCFENADFCRFYRPTILP